MNGDGRFLRGGQAEDILVFQEDTLQDHDHSLFDSGHAHTDAGHTHSDSGHAHNYDEIETIFPPKYQKNAQKKLAKQRH